VGTSLFAEGELVAPQAPVLLLGDLSALRVQTLDLSEADVSDVTVGKGAVVTVDALGGRQFRGTVARIAPLSSERRGDTVYTVVLDLDVGPDAGLRWGMTAYVEIELD
jgi:multidrug resistance efflux pump